MKNQGLDDIFNNAIVRRIGVAAINSPRQANMASAQDPLLESAELKELRQQHAIEILLQKNALLRHKLIELAKKCAHAQHFRYHDELTGLPNRSLLLDRLKQALRIWSKITS
ncbi:MAG: GGDEF domain-containing protein, partial [Methylococcales bacterium]